MIRAMYRSVSGLPLWRARRDDYIHFRLNPTTPQRLVAGDVGSVTASNFDTRKAIVVAIHGWVDDATSSFNIAVRDGKEQEDPESGHYKYQNLVNSRTISTRQDGSKEPKLKEVSSLNYRVPMATIIRLGPCRDNFALSSDFHIQDKFPLNRPGSGLNAFKIYL